MNANWRSRSSGLSPVEGAQDELGAQRVPDVIKKLLRLRGIQSLEELQNLQSPRLANLSDPFTLVGMNEAVQRLLVAFEKGEKVCVYADFDLDGSSGLALLYNGLKAMGFEHLCFYQPKRLKDGYGFHDFAVDELAAQGVSLIVTVDVGITAIEACKRARELSVDVIITDHHQPSETLPDAHVIVNPNLPSCRSGLGYLSGCGVGFYVLRALRRRLAESGVAAAEKFDLKSCLDYLTIGTITDMVPLVGDNRPLVRAGLKALSQTQRPGLRFLLRELGLERDLLTSQEVAIRFSPKLNALSRMEAEILPIHIFLETDSARAEAMVEAVIRLNQDRLGHQKSGEDEALRLLQAWPHKDFVFVQSTEFHRGVLGLLATKLMNIFGVPAFVGAIDPDGSVTGSGRWPNDQPGSLLEAMGAAQSTLVQFGGHHFAAGFELESARADEFVAALSGFFTQRSQGQTERPSETLYDVSVELSQLDEGLMQWLEAFEPYGTGFAYPHFHVSSAKILSGSALRGGHLKFQLGLRGFPHLKWEALWFSPPAAVTLDLFIGRSVEFICEIQRNYFAGRRSLQLLIRDMRLTSPAQLMDTGGTQYDAETQEVLT